MKKKPARFTGTCLVCGWSIERSKPEAVTHALGVHKAYDLCGDYLRAKQAMSA